MKSSFLKVSVLLAFGLSSNLALAGKKVWGNAYTDVDLDCVAHAVANQKADIDFRKVECKSFGGYQMFIEGADLRYSPTLEFHGKVVFSHREFAFHDMAASKVEWVYLRNEETDGGGKLEWKGFVYRLAVAREDGGKDDSRLYVVRLNGAKTCSLGGAKSNEQAHAMIQDPRTPCEK